MPTPIYHNLSLKLENYIRENNISGKLPGTRTLSKMFHVHHVTLSKALHLLEDKGIITIYPASGIYVVPKNPPRQKHNVIAIVGISNQELYLKEKFVELEKYLHARKYNLIAISFDSHIFKDNQKILLNFPVDGFLFRFSSLRNEQRLMLENENIPFVSCARRKDLPHIPQTDCDHDYGYGLMLDKLIGLGHKHIAFCEYSRIPEYQSYLDGICTLFKNKLGNNFSEEYFFTKESSEKLYESFGEDYIKVYMDAAIKHFMSLPQPPTAIIAPLPMCRKLIPLLKKQGLQVPQDISIMAMSYKYEHRYNPEISSIVFDENEMIFWGAQHLLNKLENPALPPECYLQKPIFNPGSTIAPPKK